jgi:cytochrome c-type biogenesis protein
MITDFVAQAGDYLNTNPWLALGAVFLGGVLSAASPCVLAMIPLMMGYVAGQGTAPRGLRRSLTFSFLFILGLSVTLVTLGMTAALAGKLYGDVSVVWNWVVVAVCLAMGLHLMGLVHVPIPNVVRRQPKLRGALGALVLGLLFGFVSAPCAAPILVVILTYLAGADASPAWGGLLLLAYGLGHSVLILVAGTSAGAAQTLIASRGFTRATEWLRRGAGVVILLVGAYFAWVALG